MLLRPDLVLTGRVWFAATIRLVGVYQLASFLTRAITLYELEARRSQTQMFAPSGTPPPQQGSVLLTIVDRLVESFSYSLLVPLAIGVLFLWKAGWLARVMMPMPERPLCPACGYAVGDEHACPECGLALRSTPAPRAEPAGARDA